MSEPVVETTAVPSDEPTSPPVPALRREAILPRERRGGLGAVALLCSLAGVASGFALATTILATQLAQNEARMARRSSFDGPTRHERAFLGVSYVNGAGNAAKVTQVSSESPAAEVGLAVGDLIVRYDDEALDQPWELGLALRRSPIGHEATIEVRRGQTAMILHPTLVGAMLAD